MSETVEVCIECGHPIGLHFESVDRKVRCLHVRRGVSDRGVLGLPYEIACDCVDYHSRRKREAEAEKAAARQLIDGLDDFMAELKREGKIP